MSVDSRSAEGEGRRRIVIPLEGNGKKKGGRIPGARPRATPATPRSRFKKVLKFLAVLLVLIVVAGAAGIFFWWQHYKSTPAYSLAVLIDAAQRNDTATVQSLIDTDQIVKNLGSQVTDQAASRYGISSNAAHQQIEALTPILLPRIKDKVAPAITARVQEFSARAQHKPFFLIALATPYLVKVEQSGDNATATAQAQDRPVQIQLARSDNAWKIVGYQDQALVQSIIEQVMKDLPPAGLGADKNSKVQPKRLKGLPRLHEPKIP